VEVKDAHYGMKVHPSFHENKNMMIEWKVYEKCSDPTNDHPENLLASSNYETISGTTLTVR
jgi:hypothetical protein